MIAPNGMTHASLFSGIGGAELAAAWMGWTNAFHCEINPFARKVLKHHFPNSISYEDITTTDFTPWRGHIDILTGGFPCQPFSVAGKRGGATDDRYLWPSMLRAIREIQPSWIVGENVAGLLSMVQPGTEIELGRAEHLFEENYITREEQEFTLHAILDSLGNEGYAVQTFVIPACAVGAPHRRDRVWIVAHRADTGVESLQREGEYGFLSPQTPTHSEIPRCAGQLLEKQRKKEPYRRDCRKNISDFINFPTQSPVCRRDDGISARLDTRTISFPKWREQSVMAYGNAWVPQVAYEIFKAIQQVWNRS